METLADWKGIDTSYLRNIQNHCHRHPNLKLLTALPQVPERPTRIKILEFGKRGIAEVDINKVPQLEAYWATSKGISLECRGRLYLVEDVSLPWISSLGSHFNIDPRFFVEYLKFDPDRTQNFLEGYHTMRRLVSLADKTKFSTYVYHEIRTFEGAAPRREESEILTRNNVTRLVTTVDHHGGKATGLVRRNLSIWWNACLDDTLAWETIILVDPPMDRHLHIRRWTDSAWASTTCQNTPYLEGYLDFSGWPPPLNYSHCTSQSGILDDITHFWRLAAPKELNSALSDPKYCPIFAYRIMASQWNLQLEYLVSVVSDLEKGLLRFEQMDAHPRAEHITYEVTALRTLLSDVNSWRRRVYFYLEQMKWNIDVLGVPTAAHLSMEETIGAEEGDDGIKDVTRREKAGTTNTAAELASLDFHRTLLSLRLTRQRIQSLLPVVMGAFSLLEAQHSVLKADLTIRLSSVALVFVPLSFTASLLSMSGDFIPGARLFWVFFAVAMPLIVGLFWWAYWVQVGRVRRVGLGVWKRWARKGKEE